MGVPPGSTPSSLTIAGNHSSSPAQYTSKQVPVLTDVRVAALGEGVADVADGAGVAGVGVVEVADFGAVAVADGAGVAGVGVVEVADFGAVAVADEVDP